MQRRTQALQSSLLTSAMLRTCESIAEMRTKKSFGYAVADLQNWTSAILRKIRIAGFRTPRQSSGNFRLTSGRPGYDSRKGEYYFWG
jgi:hypothetical protein